MKARLKLLVPPVAVGVVGLLLFARCREEPERTRLAERATPVRVLGVEPRTIVPRAIGYGTVEPGRTWRALAEVSGRVTWVSPLLKRGEIVPEGAELVRIDDTDYRLASARLEAEISSSEAELTKLAVSRENTEASLEVLRGTLALAERELERLRTLAEDRTVSASTVDNQEQAVLRERAGVVELENALRTNPADVKVVEARLAATGVQLDEAKRDLERTLVTAPYRCRIAEVDVEEARYVAPGSLMFEADGTEVAEIRAEMAVGRVRHLLQLEQREELMRAFERGELWESLGLECVVRLNAGAFTNEWPARFARIGGGLDPRTRTAGLVAAVDDPYDISATKGGPALVKGLFVEVEFEGRPLESRIAIPFSSVHEERVYLLDEDERLVIRDVEIDFVQFDEAILASGLEGGERLVLTDLIPAIPGMLLAPVADSP